MLKVTCLVLIKNKKVLVAKRGVGQSNAGKWEFPGGKVNQNESYRSCIKREIKEELTIEIEPSFQIESFITKEIELIPFCSNKWQGTFHYNEHEQALFIDKAKLLKLDFTDPDIPLAQFLCDNWDAINKSL